MVASCASVPVADPGDRTVTSVVKVAVPEPCLKAIPPPPPRTPINVDTATTEQLAAATVADAEAYLAYAWAARQLLELCSIGANIKGN